MLKTRRLRKASRTGGILSVTLGLLAVTLVAGAALANNKVNAEEVKTTASAKASVNVSAACTMTGGPNSGGNTYTGTITPGTSEEFGTTTLKSVCNDPLGYSIYAIGFSNDKYGNNELISSNGENNIATGTSGNNSWWAMKIGTSGSNYVPTVTNDFNNWHTVPDTYTQVAKYTGATDDGTVGSITTADYKVNVSSSQVAGTYTGKVKYTLVHPNTAAAPLTDQQIAVNYHANDSTFAGGTTVNRVLYKNNCTDMYIGNNYSISKTPNVEDDGTAASGYTYDYTQNSPVTFSGADRLKVELQYGIEEGYDFLYVFEGTYDGEITADMDEGQLATYTGDAEDFEPGASNTFYVNGDTVTFAFFADDYEDDGYYGYYAKVYPIYATEHDDTTVTEVCSGMSVESGTYATTSTNWNGGWYAKVSGGYVDFADESDVISYLNQNTDALAGSTLELYRSLTFSEAYTRAGKTTTGGNYVLQDVTNTMCPTIALGQTATLLDNRDSEKYLVGKLRGGNCWLLDNLRLDLTNSTVLNGLTPANTNADDASLTSLRSGNRSAGNQYATAGFSGSNWTSGWSYSVPMVNVSGTFNGNPYTKDTTVTTYGSGSGKIGVYYNYCAASAGSYCYGDGTSQGSPSGNAQYDVCPAGWRMPTGGADGEYQAMYTAYKSDPTAFKVALATPLSGYFNFGSAYDQGTYGYFWSSTYNSSGSMCSLYVDSSSVYPQLSYLRSYGYSVRCVLSTE